MPKPTRADIDAMLDQLIADLREIVLRRRLGQKSVDERLTQRAGRLFRELTGIRHEQ